MKERERIVLDREGPSCNVNSTFNFTIGVLAIAAAVVIGYLILNWVK